MIDEYLIRMEDRLKRIEADIKTLMGVVSGGAVAQVATDTPTDLSYGSEFAKLKELLHSDEWPIAVEPDWICNESVYKDRQTRAEGVMDFMIEDDLRGKSFFDFGCGDGLCVLEAVRRGAVKSVGFDLQDRWEPETKDAVTNHNGKALLTTAWDAVVKNGPYDFVFAFDVLDHLTSDTPQGVMRRIRQLCHADTKVFVRCHPWCSRTASHTYRQLNKAFTHLVFSDVELVRLGLAGEPCARVIHPQLVYHSVFEQAGFTITKEPEKMTEELEPFFVKTKIIADRIKKHWATSHEPLLASGQAFPEHQLKMQFLDYILAPK